MFAQALELAERTPERRNRAADFFRAVSIMLVVSGHWLVAAPYIDQGTFKFTRLLGLAPWTQLATWVFQVMPIFFLVGGFANAASWASASRDPARRRSWQYRRLRRLLVPTVPLVGFWCLAAPLGQLFGIAPELMRGASQVALVPVWFLAVYIMVTVAVPISAAVWRRWGLASVAACAGAAALVDLVAFTGGQGWLRWSNYGFVWVAVHQLGYWWHRRHTGRITDWRGPALLALAGLLALLLLTGPIGYPVSMVSVPGAEVSNSRPPTIAMLAMGCAQGGALLLVAGAIERWLRRPRIWAVVILVNRLIMTVYLWHITALVALTGGLLLAGGVGLGTAPGSPEWWLARPFWFAALLLLLVPFVLVLMPLESGARRAPNRSPGPVRTGVGAVMTCAGLTFLALYGTSADHFPWINLVPALLALGGVAVSTADMSSLFRMNTS